MAGCSKQISEAQEAMEELANFLVQEESFCSGDANAVKQESKELNYESLRERYLLAIRRLYPEVMQAKNEEEAANPSLKQKRKAHFEDEFEKCHTFIELRILWDDFEEKANDRPVHPSPDDRKTQEEIEQAENKIVDGFTEYGQLIAKDIDENDSDDESILELVVRAKKMKERSERRKRKKEKAEKRRQSRLELERLKSQDKDLFEEAKRLKDEEMNGKKRPKKINSVTAVFEKTISSNNEFGVCSGMYLNNAANPRKRAPKLKNAKMAPRSRDFSEADSERSGGGSSRSTRSNRSVKASRSNRSAFSTSNHSKSKRNITSVTDRDEWGAFDPFSDSSKKSEKPKVIEILDDDSFGNSEGFDFEDASFNDDSANCAFTIEAPEVEKPKRCQPSSPDKKSKPTSRPRAHGFVDSNTQLSSVTNAKAIFDTGQDNDLIKRCRNPSGKTKWTKGATSNPSRNDKGRQTGADIDHILKKDAERQQRFSHDEKFRKSSGSSGSKGSNNSKEKTKKNPWESPRKKNAHAAPGARYSLDQGSESTHSFSQNWESPMQRKKQSNITLGEGSTLEQRNETTSTFIKNWQSPTQKKKQSSSSPPALKRSESARNFKQTWESPSKRKEQSNTPGERPSLEKRSESTRTFRQKRESPTKDRLAQSTHESSRPSWEHPTSRSQRKGSPSKNQRTAESSHESTHPSWESPTKNRRMAQTWHEATRPSWARQNSAMSLVSSDDESMCGSVSSVVLAPSNKDNGRSRRVIKKPAQPPKEPEREVHVPIKLRKAQTNRKSSGRATKRKTKRPTKSSELDSDLDSSMSSLDCDEGSNFDGEASMASLLG